VPYSPTSSREEAGFTTTGGAMTEPSPSPHDEEIPLGQRLFDRPFLLLGLGLVVMFTFYTGWGLYEILSLPQGTLP
jgi:hypothetical protein